MSLMKPKILSFVSLMLCMLILCVPVFAADSGDETLTVNAAWVDGEMLRIDVTDANGVSSVLALRLSDYISDTETNEYISIQAVDMEGNKSGIIQIKNPYYIPTTENPDKTNETANITVDITPPEPTESVIPDGKKPFTPDGSGTVMDNVTDGDGKEFFSIKTEDGSVFYLIVDRQRNSDNVYLLNAVSEEDLMALAEKNGKEIKNGNTSAIPTVEQETTDKNGQSSTTTEPESKPSSGGNNGMYIFIGIVVLAAGGLGYYFKIIKGKKTANDADEDNEDDDINEPDDNDDEYDGGESLDEEDYDE